MPGVAYPEIWEPPLKLEDTTELRGWVPFGSICHRKGWKWPIGAAAVTGFQEPWKDFVVGVSSEPPPPC